MTQLDSHSNRCGNFHHHEFTSGKNDLKSFINPQKRSLMYVSSWMSWHELDERIKGAKADATERLTVTRSEWEEEKKKIEMKLKICTEKSFSLSRQNFPFKLFKRFFFLISSSKKCEGGREEWHGRIPKSSLLLHHRHGLMCFILEIASRVLS